MISEENDVLKEKNEDEKNDIAGFNNLLLLSLTADAYFKWYPREGVLVKPDMSTYTAVYPFNFSDISPERVCKTFDEFIKANRFTENSRRIFRYFLFICDDYSKYDAEYTAILSDINKNCEKNGIFVEFDILDLNSGTVKTIDGKKMSDRKLRKVITETIEKYRESIDKGISSENMLKDKSGELKQRYKELGMNRRVRLVNPMTLLILINITIFIVGWIMEIRDGEDLFKTFGIQDNYLIMHGEWWRLFTSMFLHADVAHIAGNMLVLFYLGSITVKYYSSLEFYAVYFFSGLCGNLLSLFLTDYRSLGASGAIMGLGGLVIYRMFFGKSAKFFRKSGNYLIFVFMILFNLLYGVFVADANIDNYGHFGGFFGGFLIALLITYIRRIRDVEKE